jgi:hypothetical protein
MASLFDGNATAAKKAPFLPSQQTANTKVPPIWLAWGIIFLTPVRTKQGCVPAGALDA